MEIIYFPDEILIEIFSQLNAKQRIAIARVCGRWETLITYNVNKDLYLMFDQNDLSNYLDYCFFLVTFPEAFKQLNRNNLVVVESFTEFCIKNIIKYFPNLKTLVIWGYKLSNENI